MLEGPGKPQRILAHSSLPLAPKRITGPKLFGNTSRTALPSNGVIRVSLHSSKP